MQEEERVEPAPAAPPPVETAEPATAPKSEGAEPPKAEEPPKPKGGFQRRIDELTRNWRESERRNDELMSLLKQQTAPPEPPKGPPTLEQHGYDESKYQAALTEYVRNLTREEARQVVEQEQQRIQRESKTQTFKQKEAEFAKSVEDYVEKVYDPTLPLSETVVTLIAESDIGPKVAYHLADNPDIARSLYNMTPTQAAREFGKLEAQLAAPAPPKAVSKAPPPAPTIEAVEPEVEKDPDKMTVKQWLKWREKDIKKNKGN